MNHSVAQLAMNKQLTSTNKYERFSYGCLNFTRVLFELDAVGSSDSDFTQCFISIYAGSDNCVNRAPALYLAERWQIEEGTGNVGTTSSVSGNSELIFAVDLGCWYLEKGAELYVAIDYPEATTSKKVEATVHAIVNAMEQPNPQRIQYRTDSAFLLEGSSDITVHGSALDENDGSVELTYGGETISQAISGCNALANIESVGDAKVATVGKCYDGLPRDIQVNTTESGVSFISEQAVEVKNKHIRNARAFHRAKLSSLRNAEVKYMKNRG